MDKSYTFVRGQVWYWEDPIYGRKERNEGIPPWDATVRFSRYVIITQSTESINPVSVLVIPCSSGSKTLFDVQVPLTHISHDNTTYARISLLFPAHPKCLQRYICTLSEVTMGKIEEKLLKLLAPSIAGAISPEELELMDNHHDEKNLDDKNDDDQKKIKQTKWNDETISAFLTLYKEGGMDAVCKEFNLKEGSVKRYYTQWSKEEVASTIEPDSDKNEVNHLRGLCAATRTNNFDSIKIINTKDSPFAVSRISNLIKETLTQISLLNDIRPHFKDSNLNIANDEFYKDIGSSIYYSLLDFLEIRKEYGVFIIPKISPEAPNIGTWNFLNRIYYDSRICTINNGIKLMELYKNYYNDDLYGIDYAWLDLLRNRLLSRLRITETGVNLICTKIEEIFCIE